MGLIGFIKSLLKAVLVACFVFIVFASLPGIPPHDLQFSSYELSPTKEFAGPLALNRKLDNAEILYENQLKGPEGIIHRDGYIYTGVHGGHVVRIKNGKIEPFVKFGKPCELLRDRFPVYTRATFKSGFHEEHICGRPLGMAFNKKGDLYVADAYYGLFKVNVSSKKVERLVGPDEEIEGRKPKLFNSVAVASDGAVYWTDSDSNVQVRNGMFSFLADGTGRLIKFEAPNKNTVLIDRLKFANGVILSPDESFLVLSESFKYRLLKFHLKGPKKGRHEVFVDGLPGAPDNLSYDDNGNFYVPLVESRDKESTPSLIYNVHKYPLARKFTARFLRLLQNVFQHAKMVLPEKLCDEMIHATAHFETVRKIMPKNKRVTVLVVNINGDIIDSLHALDKKISGICEVKKIGNHLYLGSPYNHYLARVKLNR